MRPRALVDRGVELAQRLLATEARPPRRGGRKGQRLRSAEAALAERAAAAWRRRPLVPADR